MDKKLRRGFIFSLLGMIIGVADLLLFRLNGIVILHPFIGSVLLIAGYFLFVVIFIKTIIASKELNNQIKKIENQDKLYEKDGWESCGCGLYILSSAKIDRDEEEKRRAESKAYMEKNFPKNKENK